jgi:DNA-binding NtrC family response regulator
MDGAAMTGRILLADNDSEMLDLLRHHLERDGHVVVTASSGPAALAAVEREEVDVILTDLVMDDVDGLALLRAAQESQPGARVILMTAFGSLENAIEAMRQGAHDYLTKPFKLSEVSLAVQRALEDRHLREENRRLRAQIEERFGLDALLGSSPAMQAVLGRIRAVADSEASVLLLGESGTGKELAARAIHESSPRRTRPFVPVNCTAIPEPLLESELFGHEKGAFTGADRRRRGLFAEANEGTLFLDEVGDLPLTLQGKLLRVLQDKAIRPVGASQEIQLDVRVISATNRDIQALVGEGRFREDLYYRLAVLPIRLPSLRERPRDILPLAAHFLARAAATAGKRFGGFDEAAQTWLTQHRWPGNVRELENVVERAATLARGPLITLADMGTEFAGVASLELGLRPTLAELEDRYIRRVLEDTKGDKAAAARILGVSVRTLQRRYRD